MSNLVYVITVYGSCSGYLSSNFPEYGRQVGHWFGVVHSSPGVATAVLLVSSEADDCLSLIGSVIRVGTMRDHPYITSSRFRGGGGRPKYDN
jgi:hypothetical protein